MTLRLAFVQLIVILFAIPIQFTILKKSSQKIQEIKINNFFNDLFHYLSPCTWLNWLISISTDHPVSFDLEIHKITWRKGIESPAIEVLHLREQHGYFATSPTIRSPRPEHVHFRIGQVIRHKFDGYRAVIVGWDEQAQVPDRLFKEYSKYAKQPNYSVLVDTRDRHIHKTYIPQEQIEILINTKIVNAQLTDYFYVFDGTQYTMKSWLRELYPHD